MLEIRRAEEHGVGKTDWLDARIRFSFGPYQDPEQVGFSDLRLLNDDRVKGGGGFAEHAHQDTEVFSYVVEGVLAHKDSMGLGSAVKPGEVLTMSAGTGITHSEFNGSQTEPVRFLQIWMAPDRTGVAPRYHQRYFAPEEKRGRLRLIISPDGADGSLPFYQDTRIYAGLLDGAESATLQLPANRYAYVQVVRGEVALNGERLKEGDGVKVRRETLLTLSDGRDAEVLVFDLRPLELPPA
jgi:redox-sensitive bicupin YhaK (pirin superfamily)